MEINNKKNTTEISHKKGQVEVNSLIIGWPQTAQSHEPDAVGR